MTYATGMKTVPLPSGRQIPVLGQGTWGIGDDAARRKTEVAALRLGLDLGMTLIDTAEMYAEGGAEQVIADAIAGRRLDTFIVSKVYPHNATRHGTVEACDHSLRRLKTDHIDLYLLHWRESTPLAETLEAFQSLKQSGKILDYGVSNLDQDDMEEATAQAGGDGIVVDQVLYNLMQRGIEWDLLPWCRKRGIRIMAYSPIEGSGGKQPALLNHPTMHSIASRHSATPAQVALAWLLQKDVIVIPKSADPKHVRENRGVLDVELTEHDLEELDQAFPPPRKKVELEMR